MKAFIQEQNGILYSLLVISYRVMNARLRQEMGGPCTLPGGRGASAKSPTDPGPAGLCRLCPGGADSRGRTPCSAGSRCLHTISAAPEMEDMPQPLCAFPRLLPLMRVEEESDWRQHSSQCQPSAA